MLIFDHVSYSYPARQMPAVQDISLSLTSGRRIALLGANGSGKSTLARLANGLLLPDTGTVRVDGLSTESQQTVRELRKLVGIVFQDPDNQIISSSVLDDIAFGPENLGLPRAEIARRCAEALALVGLTGYEARDPNTLSGGEKQRLVIAGILAMEPRYLVLDEPTSMLDVSGRREVRAAINSLHDRGHGILHVTHDLEEALDADEIVVLKEGRIVFTGTPQQLMQDVDALSDYRIALTPLLRLEALLAEPVAASDAGAAASSSQRPTMPEPATGHSNALTLEHVSYTYAHGISLEHQALQDINLKVQPGSYLLVIGRTGSGKSTLLRIGSGLLAPDSGTAAFSDGAAIQPGAVGLVFQQPETQLFAQTVAEDICFGPRNLGLLPDAQAQEQVVRETLEMVGLDHQEFATRSPFNLSGGESRRVALATVLAMQPRFLLLDEPTAGLDAWGRCFVHGLIGDLLNRGVGIIVVSHDLDEFLPQADDVLILDGGQTVWSGSAVTLIHDPSPLQTAGLQVPGIIAFQQNEGMPAESYTLDPAEAADRIRRWRNKRGEN